MRFKTVLKNTVIILVILIVTFPVAFMVTFMTFPLWRRFEEITGIESFGHSGPDDWCFWLVYLLFIVVAGKVWLTLRKVQKT